MKNHTRFGTIITLLSLIVLINALGSQNIHAQVGTGIVRVAPTGTDVGDCGSEAKPCRTPNYAMQFLFANGSYSGELRLAAGRYAASDYAHIILITFPGNMRISGGYSSTSWNVSDPTNNVTILDGQKSKRGIFISVPGNAAAACHMTISNLSIENGRSSTEVGNTYGGGILIDNCADVRVSNVTVRNSQALGLSNTGNVIASPGAGGAIAVRGDEKVTAGLTLQNVTMTGNQAIGGNESSFSRGGLGVGGALFATLSTVTLKNVTLSDNSAQAGNAPVGSGINNGQQADGLGGGIALIHVPSFNINGLTMQRNSSKGGDASNLAGMGLGGGMFIEHSTGNISHALLQANTTTGGTSSGANGTGGAGHGGAIFQTDTALTLNAVTMLDNSATAGPATGASSQGANGGGGGLFATVGVRTNVNNLIATNLIIARNKATASSGTAKNGGDNSAGLMMDQTIFTINHAVIADNVLLGSYDKLGAAVAMLGDQTKGTLQNTIIANHSIVAAVYVGREVGSITLDTILSNGNTGGFIQSDSTTLNQQNILSGDPAFVNDFHIGAGSAAIDRANGNAASIDIDDQSRPVGQAADIGADEFQIALNASAGDTTVDLSWQAPAGTTITRYVIEYTGGGSVDAGAQTSYTLTGLAQKTSYTIKIIGYNGNTRVIESAPMAVFTGAVRIFVPLVSGAN